MNEGAKTGMYWVVAAVMLAVATFVSWPQELDSDSESLIGQPLFSTFTDPLAASSLRIVRFDEEQGELQRFEVAKDEATGVWSLPSRNNYPADAAQQMQAAANSLVGVKVLDIQTENPEDHASLGVVEPKADALEVGDEGVGLLVSFKGEKNASLANLIIGNAAPGATEKRYVRIPGENPVYVVNLNNSVFSTKFADWIEKDLLQLSSIEVARVDMQVYDSALESAGSLSMNRNYDASVEVEGTSDWKLLSLVKYDKQQEPQPVTLAEGEKLATAKLNELKNALDELKIADVAAKPKGMSENLKADKELVSDNEAVRSLAVRGFFPINSGEIISANGEMSVTLNDGVQYVLRFGNVEGISDEGDAENEEGKEAPSAGANRYLLVTAQVDESKFPAPALKPIPKTIEDLEAMNAPAPAAADAPTADPASPPPASATDSPKPESATEPAATEPPASEPAATEPAAEQPKTDAPAETPAAEPDQPAAEPADPAAAVTEEPSDACSDDEPAPAAEPTAADDPAAEPADQSPQADAKPEAVEEVAPVAEEPKTDAPSTDNATPAPVTPAPAPTAPATPAPEETEEEKQERLEAEQEKITKENQRLIDERNDRIETARRRVRELNSRFADWYYVIPESTYRKLRISVDELIEKPAAAGTESPVPTQFDPSSDGPTLQIPGVND